MEFRVNQDQALPLLKSKGQSRLSLESFKASTAATSVKDEAHAITGGTVRCAACNAL
jgi:hypothetical protein